MPDSNDFIFFLICDMDWNHPNPWEVYQNIRYLGNILKVSIQA